MQREQGISVVIAAYNEEKTIGDVISRVAAVMQGHGAPFEIIVVDDGSTDNTKNVASSHNATVVSDGKNHGKGHAVRQGFKKANGDIIVTIDADGEHKPIDILGMINPLYNGTDIVAGSRFLGKGKNFTTRLNMIGNKILNLVITLTTRKHITDSQTGFRAFKKTFLQNINLESDGFEIEAEITVKGLRNGFKLQEIPIHSERRQSGKSKLRIGFDAFKALNTILKSSFTPMPHTNHQPAIDRTTTHAPSQIIPPAD